MSNVRRLMDQLLEVVFLAAVLWRAVLGAAFGALAAFLTSLVFPALPGAAWFALSFVGGSLGFIWHAGVVSAREAANGRKAEPISGPISFLGIALIGGLWGWLVASAFGIVVAVLTLLVMPSVLGPIFGRVANQQVAPRAIVFATIASLVGFSVPYAVNFAFGVSGA